MGWRRKLKRAKKLHRPDLKDWERDDLYEEFPAWRDRIIDQSAPQTFCLFEVDPSQSVPLILDSKDLKLQEFHKYEREGTPCVIRGIPDGFDASERTGEWPALKRWSLSELEKDEDLRNRVFKCGEDDDGKSIKVKLKHFLKYLYSNVSMKVDAHHSIPIIHIINHATPNR